MLLSSLPIRLIDWCVKAIGGISYWVLDHLHALSPHLGDNGRNVHYILLGSLLQSHVNSHQCTCPPHTSTAGRDDPSLLWQSNAPLYISDLSWPAVYQCRSSWEFHLGLHSTKVVEDWSSILWNTVVWPGGEVELSHLQLVSSSLVTLHGDEQIKTTQHKYFKAIMRIESIDHNLSSLNSRRQTAVWWCSRQTPAGLWEWLWTDHTPWSPALASTAHTSSVLPP